MALVPLAVTVEIRALDTGPQLARAFRLSRAIDETLLRLERDLPFEPGRRVAAELVLPDEDQPISVTGQVARVAPNDEGDEAAEGEESRPRAIAIASIDPRARARLLAYLAERTRSK